MQERTLTGTGSIEKRSGLLSHDVVVAAVRTPRGHTFEDFRRRASKKHH